MQLAFCREYVKDFNGAQAAIRAGYSEKGARQQAYKQLEIPAVQEEIKRLTQLKIERASIEADEVVETLAQIIRANIADVVQWGSDNQTTEEGLSVVVPFVKPIPSEDLARETTAAVSEVSMSKDGTFKVKLADKLGAIDKMMKHLGMFEADNRQRTDPIADLVKEVQGAQLAIATRKRRKLDLSKRRAAAGDANA